MKNDTTSQDERDPAVPAEESSRSRESLVALCFLGVAAFNPMIIRVFDVADAFVFGIPLLYAYIFFAWAILILLMACVVERGSPDRGDGASPPPGDRS
jgi:hypothetical protein